MEILSLIFAGGSLAVSGITVWWIQRRLDRRELEKWRRDTLTSAASQLIATSNERSTNVISYVSRRPSPELFKERYADLGSQLNRIYEHCVRIQLCNEKPVFAIATKIEDEHRNNSLKLLQASKGQDIEKQELYMDIGTIAKLHQQLIDEMLKYLKLDQ